MAGLSLWNTFLIACILLSFTGAALPAAGQHAQTPPPPGQQGQPLRLEEYPHYPSSKILAETQSPAAPAAPDALADWSKIVFYSYRDNNWEIYRALGDGSAQTRLTNHSAIDADPRLNRGCTKITFSSNRDGDYEIFTMNPDGSGLVQLTRNTSIYDEFPAWSPDGTKIAFQTDRDGQVDVYSMNADGSGLVRLTSATGYDGQPVWSPDGLRLAFTSDRSGNYNIWVMNADGSAQVQLSTQNYSSNAAWSPDGLRIAYSADGNNNGWSEIWWMNANGSSQTLFQSPGSTNTDLLVRSWSPDGLWLGYTTIAWVYSNNQWYWTTAHIDSIRLSDHSSQRLNSTGYDWYPDWQTCDILPPTSGLNPLPEVSPGKFPVSWSGTDAGPSGVMGYDIQVRDGPSGAWTDWLSATYATNVPYPGVGGHTYYFRSRARDNSLNAEAWPPDYEAFTTVEEQIPFSEVRQLDLFTPNAAAINWQGWDPGGSLIEKYDIQARPASSHTWQDWLLNTSAPSAPFSGISGERYFFRSKAIDTAQNAEDWSQGDGDASTTFYDWGMRGRITDQTGLPVGGAVITTTPGAFAQYPLDHPGLYGAYVAQISGAYTIDWGKPGYGDLPVTGYTSGQGGVLDIVLPPADNQISDGTFESGNLYAWTAGGTILPVISTQKHTGSFAALLGSRPQPSFTSPTNLASGRQCSVAIKMEMDPSGVIHLMCGGQSSQNQLFYARRELNGAWSALQVVSTNQVAMEEDYYYYDFAVDQSGGVHVIWSTFSDNNYDIYYRWRDPGGVWSSTINLSNKPPNSSNGYLSNVSITADAFGQVLAAWEYNKPGVLDIYYAWRAINNVWSAPQNLTNEPNYSYKPELSADPFGRIHMTWSDSRTGNHDVFYLVRSASGVWSAPVNLTSSPTNNFYALIAFDPFGGVHFAWQDTPDANTGVVLYRWQDSTGKWSDIQNISNLTSVNNPCDLFVDNSGRVKLLWKHDRTLYISTRDSEGRWNRPEQVYSTSNYVSGELLPDMNDNIHLLIKENQYLRYRKQGPEGVWSNVIDLASQMQSYEPVGSQIDLKGIVHLVWPDWASGSLNPYYRRLVAAGAEGNSVLSQQVMLHVDMASPVLSFLYQFSGGDPQPGSRFAVSIDNGSVSSEVFSTAAYTNNWMHQWVDLSPWAGQMVTVSFVLQQAAGVPFAWALLDDVTVGASRPDLWLYKNAVSPAVIPGQNAVFTLTYGNQGGASVASVRITDTLPAELAFVSASPAPVTTTPSLVWDLPALPPSSGPYTIELTTTLTSTLPALSKVENHATIGPVTGELERMNNFSTEIVAAGQLLYFPIIQWR
jgi:uncharacterized repeat protein (TIGR01451 family)